MKEASLEKCMNMKLRRSFQFHYVIVNRNKSILSINLFKHTIKCAERRVESPPVS